MNQKNSFSSWLKSISSQNRLVTVIVIIVFVLSFELLFFWLGVKVMSGIRAYVAGEDAWTKGQKNSHYALQAYTISRSEEDYNKIADHLHQFIGDRNAKNEMKRGNFVMNEKYVSEQFVAGEVHPGDTGDMIFLFKYFKWTPWLIDAIKEWDEGDENMERFVVITHEIHDLITTPINPSDSLALTERDLKITNLIQEENILDQRSTANEKNFAIILGEGSRAIKLILLVLAIIFNLLLGALAIFISVFISRVTVQVEKEKGDFMRVANHQLNTPISIMKNAYAMIEDGSLDAEKGIQYMGSGLTRVVNVFNDIKTVLEFDGQVHYDFKKNDIVPIVTQAVTYAQKTAATAKKDVSVIIQPPTFTLPQVICDPTQLNNALYNLLDNAVQYTPKGTVTISYQLVDRKFLKINIQDTGIGFTPEDKEKLGQKFYRSKKALLARPDGSGLGLYICKNIIGAHGGQLFFDSPGEGKGATFGFTLPMAS